MIKKPIIINATDRVVNIVRGVTFNASNQKYKMTKHTDVIAMIPVGKIRLKTNELYVEDDKIDNLDFLIDAIPTVRIFRNEIDKLPTQDSLYIVSPEYLSARILKGMNISNCLTVGIPVYRDDASTSLPFGYLNLIRY